MSSDPHGTSDIPVGISVVGFNGEDLGQVHEVHPHYLLVGQEGQHVDLEVPVHAIVGVSEGKLQVSVTRESSSPVDTVETARTQIEGMHREH
jgi:hypothetical protein